MPLIVGYMFHPLNLVYVAVMETESIIVCVVLQETSASHAEFSLNICFATSNDDNI